MAKSGAQAQAEKPEAQKGSATKMPIFLTKFDGSGSDNTDEFRRTLIGHIELQGTAASFYKALLKGAPGFWLVRGGRPLLRLSGSVFAYTYKMLASAALQRRILATSWHRCTG